MTKTVQQYCHECVVCQRTKADTRRPAGLYTPLEVPRVPWEQLHIDFVVELPSDEGYKTVMTVVDRFSRMCCFVPLKNTDAESVAKAFFKEVVANHGLPRVLISDRDPRFTGQFWRTIMKTFNTKLHFTTAFHPQSDGLAEVSNRTLEQLLRAHCQDTTRWVETLPLVALLYNATPQSRTKEAPYTVATGRALAMPIDIALADTNVPAATQFTKNLQTLWDKVHYTLT